MPATLKKQSQNESAEERERILHAISERWHGNLAAYLEAVARVRNSAAHRDDTEEAVVHSLLKSVHRR